MKKALVVDDSPFTTAILTQHLKEFGFEVESAPSATRAMSALARTTPPDVILLDWVMPGMSGIELVEWLKHQSTCATTPIIMVTAQTDLAHVREALDHGVREYVMKPFTKEELQEKLRLAGFEV